MQPSIKDTVTILVLFSILYLSNCYMFVIVLNGASRVHAFVSFGSVSFAKNED